MNDPGDQRASDEALKRNTNLTPVGIRQALDATAIDFQRRVDSQASTTPTVSTPKAPQQIVVTETRLDGQPITLPDQNDNQNPFPKNSTGFDGSGTAATPYEMGENRTTTDPTAADDTWTRAGGPIPDTPDAGPFDSVVTTNPRAFFDGTNWILYFRREQFDSNGAIFAIGAESAVTLTP